MKEYITRIESTPHAVKLLRVFQDLNLPINQETVHNIAKEQYNFYILTTIDGQLQISRTIYYADYTELSLGAFIDKAIEAFKQQDVIVTLESGRILKLKYSTKTVSYVDSGGFSQSSYGVGFDLFKTIYDRIFNNFATRKIIVPEIEIGCLTLTSQDCKNVLEAIEKMELEINGDS